MVAAAAIEQPPQPLPREGAAAAVGETRTTHIVRSNFHNIYKHTRVANPYGHTIIIKGS